VSSQCGDGSVKKEDDMERKTVNVTIDGRSFDVEEGSTILQAAHEFGIHIPTVCYMENLTPYGGCRICVVEINDNGGKPFIDTSCTREVREGMVIQTKSPKIIRARKMLAELLVTSAPNVKMAQDIAARMGLLKVRFPMEDNRCILCGLCIAESKEQRVAAAEMIRAFLRSQADRGSRFKRKSGRIRAESILNRVQSWPGPI